MEAMKNGPTFGDTTRFQQIGRCKMTMIACYIRDEKTSRHIQDTLMRAGFACEAFLSETSLLRTMRRRRFDLVLMDTGVESDAEERMFSWLNCRTGESTPVVVLSSSRSPHRVALALDAGADDYISYQVDAMELVARLQAVMRRCKPRGGKHINLGGYTLNLDASTLQDRGTQVSLTPREFMMAWLLFSAPGQYLSRETISVAIWGVDADITNRTIEQHIYKLRKRLGLSEERGVTIRTGYTQGYRLEVAEEAAA